MRPCAERAHGIGRPRPDSGVARRGDRPGAGQQGEPRGRWGAGDDARRGHRSDDHPGRLRALRAAPARERRAGSRHDRQARAHGLRRSLPWPHEGRARERHPRAGAGPPDLGHGREDHDRQRHAHEQGPRGDRGAAALRRAARRDRRGRAPAVDHPRPRSPERRRLARAHGLPRHARADLVRAPLPRADRRARSEPRPRRPRAAHLRGARRGHLPVPAPGPRGVRGRRHGPVCAERGERDRGAGLPRRRDRLHGDRGGDRARTRRPRARARAPLLRPLPRRRGGSDQRAGADRGSGGVSWDLAALGFMVLIVAHEAGHFTAAKLVGMRVEKFALFFGPPIWKKQVGETEYSIRTIPAGGYVKITGMNPSEELSDEARTRAYYSQPVWKRIVVISAGPAVNLVIGFVLLLVYAGVIGLHKGNEVGDIAKNFPAQGVLHPGDVLVAVDGKTGSVEDLTKQGTSHRCAVQPPTSGCKATSPAVLTIERDGKRVTITMTPVWDAKFKRMRLGFSYNPNGGDHETVSPGESLDRAATAFWNITKAEVSLPAKILDSGQRAQIHGLVGSYESTRQTILADPGDVILIMALISLALAIVNLFPFLPLDGGHIFWAIVEKVRGRPVPFSTMERSGVIGFALVLMLFALGLTNDIHTLSNGGFKAP